MYRSGLTKIGAEDQRKVVGGFERFVIRPEQALFIESTSDEDSIVGNGATEMVVTGFSSSGTPLIEKVSLKGTARSFTETKFAFIDNIIAEGNIGNISVSVESGYLVGNIPPRTTELRKAAVFVWPSWTVEEYGVSSFSNVPTTPTEVSLVKYVGDSRTVLHTMFAPTEGGVCSASVDIEITEPCVVCVEAQTIGKEVHVSAWMKAEQEELDDGIRDTQ